MSPTRNSNSVHDVIDIHDTESESEQSPPPKRQKLSKGSSQNMDKKLGKTASIITLASKNANLKGRKRFSADLEDVKDACKKGFVAHGFKASKLRPGDEEGSFELFVTSISGDPILSVNILISDTSDYPKDHTFFSYSLESDPSSNIQDVIETIASSKPRSIPEMVEFILFNLHKAMSNGDIEDEEADDDDDGYEAFDLDDDLATSQRLDSKIQLSRMQTDFIDTVASSYRPALIRFGGDDFCVCVSLPVIHLAETIPPRALMAWDRRLLSKSQYLVLLISGFSSVYPSPDYSGAAYQRNFGGVQSPLTFKVGLCGKYKPGKDYARDASKKHKLILADAEDLLREQKEKEKQEALAAMYEWDGDGDDPMEQPLQIEPEQEQEQEDPERFDKFSLSSSLESLMDQSFLKLVNIRRRNGLGWAGAELVLWEIEKNQMREEDVLRLKAQEIRGADMEERELARTNNLPHDPLSSLSKDEDVNVPLAAFCYLVRRLTLCTRYCSVCHNKLHAEYEVLKPYVCDSKLCSYQFYCLGKGPSLEYEIIHNPSTVDLLVSLAFSAAAEGVMDEPLPAGMGLRVPNPDTSKVLAAPARPSFAAPINVPGMVVPQQATPEPQGGQAIMGVDGLYEFDQLSRHEMRASIVQLLDSLPPIDDMRKHLLRKVNVGKPKPKLQDTDPNVLLAAWQLLRWVLGSCTAYLEEITDKNEAVKNIDPMWRQYRFSVGAPDAEAKFNTSVEEARKEDRNCVKYPALFGFHGSPLRNWHSIIRHGLWFKDIAHGRAYGNGVYLAKDGSVSMGSYTGQNRTSGWRKSRIGPVNCVALVEIVNQPYKFVSNNPYYVVSQTHWLICRYLLVKSSSLNESLTEKASSTVAHSSDQTPHVKLDPKQPVTLNNKAIEIPEPSYQINVTLQARRDEYQDDENDDEDREVFEYTELPAAEKGKGKETNKAPYDVDGDFDMDFEVTHTFVGAPASTGQSAPAASSRASKRRERPADDWVHDAVYVNGAVANLMPPPEFASPGAAMAVQKELKLLLKEQANADSLKDLGWYLPPDLIGDNLFQWIVELHSFDENTPIAKDMKKANLNSIIFEIRFPPDFPLAPPFFRIITPRFLPFIHGGGGHVTGGGSICMDLLTSSGWLPSYSVAAILVQIKLAISNLEPRPARLFWANDRWKQPYAVSEALEGYKRAATTHGWKVPDGIDRLVR